MATVTTNTAQPVGTGDLEYEKELEKAYRHRGGGSGYGGSGFSGQGSDWGNHVNRGDGSGYGGGYGGGGKKQNGTSSSKNPSTEDYLNQIYDSSLESQKQLLQSNYETDISNLDAEKAEAQRQSDEDLSRTYVEAYKKAKNFNEVQNAYGLTSGAMGQAALAQGNQLQANLTDLRAVQEQVDAEIERQRSILGKEYAAAIAKAQADNDYQRAKALYEQAQREEERLLQLKMAAGELMASVGDYSILQDLYGLSRSQVQALEEYYFPEDSGSSGGGGSGTVSYATWLANLSNSDRKALTEAGEI